MSIFAKALLSQPFQAQASKVMAAVLTGHSLGGALATLAAHELVAALNQAATSIHVSCYTFGAPRTGNHAFARDYQSLVPDTWGLINDQVRHLLCTQSMFRPT